MAEKIKESGFWGPFLPGYIDDAKDAIFGFDSYDYSGLPEGSTYKDYINELQKSRDSSLYSRYDVAGDKDKAIKQEGDEIRADINSLFPNRKDNDGPSNKGRNMRDVGGDKYGLEDKAALARAALSNAEKAQAIKDAEAAEREAFLDSPKGRMQTMFNDADKRDAILGGISDAMLETRVGADAYGNRFARASKNVRNNLKVAEATDIARQQATLDAMKTMAETNKLVDPRQYMTDAQTEARSIVNARIRSGALQPGDFDTAYAAMLKQITVKDLTSAKASSISTMFTYAQALQGSDPVTAGILMDAIKSNALYLAGGADGGAQTGEVTIDATEYNTGN